jgi:hypothetical protein
MIIYIGNSLYAFSISPELTLEHLYWGETLHPGYDLRYLSQSSRMAHFSTAEAAPMRSPPNELAFATGDSMNKIPSNPFGELETLSDVEKTWLPYASWKSGRRDDIRSFQQRRSDNFNW